MTKKSESTPAERLARAKTLAEQGKIEIGNDAARAPGSVVVKSYPRHGANRRPEGERGVIVFQWSRPGIGFGEILFTTKEGKLLADVEAMSDEFVLDVVRQALRERKEK